MSSDGMKDSIKLKKIKKFKLIKLLLKKYCLCYNVKNSY